MAGTGGPNREGKGIGEDRREYGGMTKIRGHLKGHFKKDHSRFLNQYWF